MTQGLNEGFWQGEARTQQTKQLIRDIKRITRRKFTTEEKIRIVLEGFRPDTPIRDLCRREGIRPGTYHRWIRRQAEGKLQDSKGGSSLPWNRLRPEEEERILTQARASPELSACQLALKLINSEGWYVSESTVFPILKREGLIKPAEIVGFKAGKEYHRKTKKPNELWATDCSHIKVIDWGWYYLVTVMDDYSHFIAAWELKSDMATAHSLMSSRRQ